MSNSIEQVLFIYDGNIGDMTSLALLCTMNINILGVVVVPADCIGEYCCQATRKLLDFCGKTYVDVAYYDQQGPNPFVWDWRANVMTFNLLPVINQTPARDYQFRKDAAQFIVDVIMKCLLPVTVVCVGPVNPLRDACRLNRKIQARISRLIYMGGALLDSKVNPVPCGNINPRFVPSANTKAEWNIFWDPQASYDILHETDLQIILIPLNITNKAVLTESDIKKFAKYSKEYPLYDLAGNAYSVVAFQDGYCYWDEMATAYIAIPDCFNQVIKVPLNVGLEGDMAGVTYIDEDKGRQVTVVIDASEQQIQKFYDYFFEAFKFMPPSYLKEKEEYEWEFL